MLPDVIVLYGARDSRGVGSGVEFSDDVLREGGTYLYFNIFSIRKEYSEFDLKVLNELNRPFRV